MPLFQRTADGSTAIARAQKDGREAAYRLTREGVLFLTEILGVREGDEFRPTDLQLLVDRGWAALIEPDAPPEPAAPPPSPAPGWPSPPDPPPAAGRAKASDASTSRPALARRTRGREVALQVLYLQEQNPAADEADIDRFLVRRLRDPKLCEFARSLVAGTRANQPRIDELIAQVAENWRLDRMAAIDRNILRLGAYELLHCPDVPRKVAINEALELAKRYSTAQSSRFVNGILDRLQAAESAPPETESEPPERAE